jgi:hypothetical protein
MKNLKIKALALITIISFSSCSKDSETKAVVEEEVFTTITAVFTPVGGGTTVTLRSRDLDGVDGPNQPVITVVGTFDLNKTYNGDVTALDETKTPAKDMTEDILEKPLEHQLFYIKTGTLPSFTYTPASEAASNYDVNGKPIGLKSKFVTTTAATGSLRIVLKHEGNKSAPGVSNGDYTNASGSSDFDVTFNGLSVQ